MSRAGMYQEVGQYSEVMGAAPSKQISLLLGKLISDLEQASVALQEGLIVRKSERLSHAGQVIDYLRDCLDFNQAPEVAKHLDGYYQRLEMMLFKVNARNDAALLQDALAVSQNIKAWWDDLIK